MHAAPTPTPEEARDSLDQVSASRHAAAQATRRPVWIDAGMSITIGAALALGPGGYPVAAIAVLVVGSLVFTIAQRRLSRSHGQLVDQKAVGARMLRFAILFVALFVLLQFGPSNWQPWYSVILGAVAAIGSFAWLRWEDRYRAGRLGAGDYHHDDQL